MLRQGELAAPLARYCSDKGVTEAQVLNQAAREHLVYCKQCSGANATEKAIAHLQAAVAKRFGRDFDTDAGAGTLYISHDGVSLTNPQSSIIAQRVGSVGRQLIVAKESCAVE